MKKFKVEPPEIVRQIFEAGLTVTGRDGLGELRMYYPEDLTDKFIEGRTSDYYPPSWIKELEPEQIPASRLRDGSPIEVQYHDGDEFHATLASYQFDGHQLVRPWKNWRIPEGMDKEIWKRECLLPERSGPGKIDQK